MKVFSEETKMRMSISAKKRCTLEWRQKRSKITETPLDTEQVRFLYEAGRTQSEIAQILHVSQKVIWRHMKNHGIKARVACKRNQYGTKNSSWKDTNASYSAFHSRVYRVRGKANKYPCSICGTTKKEKPREWANLTGNYHDIYDYTAMCRSYHREYDKKRRSNGGDNHV